MVAEQQSKMHRLVLDQPLVSLSISYDGQEKVATARHKAEVDASYKSGYEDASSQYNQQILDFRSEINALREGTFSQLEQKFQTIVSEAREALMTLTYECVKQTLGGFEMVPEAVEKIVESVVEESGLNEEQMIVRLHSSDIALLEDLEKDLKARHPGLEFVADDTLSRGDCMLSSRFGKIDGLMSTKLEKLQGGLTPS
ncbi:FliH/SctL family protein [Pelagicoccus sp. SDUM812003]|uniref:FliH/SctL family protein n=1 Tax=Pelagicoccus sp. SDUM812003 TaxID=3041267 RepID=UPI00280D34B8|nr:FliH/SctL family protein [Pelagicoccus sp. SDUM812003]MDQ8202532.1 FliH/SctL family protein [Pelagicoccus sp. SDUM812003]